MTQPMPPAPLGLPCRMEWHSTVLLSEERRRAWCKSCKWPGCQCPNHKPKETK